MPLPPEVADYLKFCGLSKAELERCNPGTRLFHDLGLYGDIADAYIETLAKRHSVDISKFEFPKYFPPEFLGNSFAERMLYWLVPFVGRYKRARMEYRPLTLEMIAKAIRQKQLPAA